MPGSKPDDRAATQPTATVSPALAAACQRATAATKTLSEPTDRDATLNALIAYRDISRVAGLDGVKNSACVAELLDMLSQSDSIDQLSSLCPEWINWNRRKTDGMLLIGKLIRENDQLAILLDDQTHVVLKDDMPHVLPIGKRVVLLGSIENSGKTPLVRTVAGVVAP